MWFLGRANTVTVPSIDLIQFGGAASLALISAANRIYQFAMYIRGLEARISRPCAVKKGSKAFENISDK